MCSSCVKKIFAIRKRTFGSETYSYFKLSEFSLTLLRITVWMLPEKPGATITKLWKFADGIPINISQIIPRHFDIFIAPRNPLISSSWSVCSIQYVHAHCTFLLLYTKPMIFESIAHYIDLVQPWDRMLTEVDLVILRRLVFLGISFYFRGILRNFVLLNFFRIHWNTAEFRTKSYTDAERNNGTIVHCRGYGH
jgi:hypothetical protein